MGCGAGTLVDTGLPTSELGEGLLKEDGDQQGVNTVGYNSYM